MVIGSNVAAASARPIMLSFLLVNPRCAWVRMRSEGYSSRSVCLFVRDYSRTTGYEAAYERYQQLQCYKSKKKNVAISLKTTAFERYGVKTS